jgi:cytochrome P450
MQLTEWSKQYGGIYSLKFAHATAIVLTDRRLIRELIDKRGTIYNSRQNVFIINRYVARDPANIPLVIFLPSGDKLRLCRKLLNQYFNETRVEQKYVPIIEAESKQMVFDLWKKPEDRMIHPVRLANSVIMTLVYGRRTNDANQLRSYLKEFEKYARLLGPGAIPPVDLLPWLEYVPQSLWLGCWKNWKSKGDEAGRRVYNNFSTQAKSVIERRERGINAGSFYDFLLDQEDKTDLLTRRDLTIFAGSLIDAGSDTTASSVGVFIQAMCKYPDVQARAHKQVDKVIGNNRSPRWSDFSTLPYVVQIIKEVLRWRPVAGTMPHSTTAGMSIYQKGTFQAVY